jgi:hypothetical protein
MEKALPLDMRKGFLFLRTGSEHEERSGAGRVPPSRAQLQFVSLLPGRNYSSDAYRFGFQGQEKDDEVHGATGTS